MTRPLTTSRRRSAPIACNPYAPAEPQRYGLVGAIAREG